MDEEDRKIISRWKRLIKQMLRYGPAFGMICVRCYLIHIGNVYLILNINIYIWMKKTGK